MLSLSKHSVRALKTMLRQAQHDILVNNHIKQTVND